MKNTRNLIIYNAIKRIISKKSIQPKLVAATTALLYIDALILSSNLAEYEKIEKLYITTKTYMYIISNG